MDFNTQPHIRYIQFCLVGLSGLGVDMLFLWLLADRLEWGLAASKVIAAEIALLNNFIWNDRWTFNRMKSQTVSSWFVRWFRFHLICIVGIGMSVVLLQLFVYGLFWNVYLSNFLSIVLVSLWNFFMSMKWNWNKNTRA